jgi:hypothetical protein
LQKHLNIKVMSKNFKIESGEMVLSDPCYEIPTWCQGIVKVANGLWETDIERNSFGDRIARLWAYNLEAAINDPKIIHRIEEGNGSPIPFSAGVDSGQFGFFDRVHYRNDESSKELPKQDFGDNWDRQDGDSWYRACCELTLGEDSWGVLPFGVVSTSGYGDGSYMVVGIKNSNSEYIAIGITFISENDDEDDDFEDEEEI